MLVFQRFAELMGELILNYSRTFLLKGLSLLGDLVDKMHIENGSTLKLLNVIATSKICK